MSDTATATAGDFWASSGHHLLDRDRDGRLALTPEYLKAYLARPEIVPPAEACLAERALYDRLRRDPAAPVRADEIGDIADRDARENWRHLVAFRDHLAAHPTLESAYLALARAKRVTTPPLFLNQLVHVILRNVLDGEKDAFVLRAAELFWRPQRLTLRDGVMRLADEERVDGANVVDHASPLVAIFGDARAKDLEVLGPALGPAYFARSDAHDLVIDFRHGEPARAAFARVIERFVVHLLGAGVTVEPLERLDGVAWRWFVGLDAEGTQIGNALWRGEEPPHEGRERIVALFRLAFAEPALMREEVRGAPVYLILAMTANRVVRVKPQNLIAGLPLRAAAGAH
jgi:hypothetical protein